MASKKRTATAVEVANAAAYASQAMPAAKKNQFDDDDDNGSADISGRRATVGGKTVVSMVGVPGAGLPGMVPGVVQAPSEHVQQTAKEAVLAAQQAAQQAQAIKDARALQIAQQKAKARADSNSIGGVSAVARHEQLIAITKQAMPNLNYLASGPPSPTKATGVKTKSMSKSKSPSLLLPGGDDAPSVPLKSPAELFADPQYQQVLAKMKEWKDHKENSDEAPGSNAMDMLLPLFDAAVHRTKVVYAGSADERQWKRARTGSEGKEKKSRKKDSKGGPKKPTKLSGYNLFVRELGSRFAMKEDDPNYGILTATQRRVQKMAAAGEAWKRLDEEHQGHYKDRAEEINRKANADYIFAQAKAAELKGDSGDLTPLPPPVAQVSHINSIAAQAVAAAKKAMPLQPAQLPLMTLPSLPATTTAIAAAAAVAAATAAAKAQPAANVNVAGGLPNKPPVTGGIPQPPKIAGAPSAVPVPVPVPIAAVPPKDDDETEEE